VWLSLCLESGAGDLHMVQVMPCRPIVLAPVKSRMVYLSDAGLPRVVLEIWPLNGGGSSSSSNSSSSSS